MTDMRRTLLWVVFTMSLVLLWDAWNKHTGQPSMFGGPRPAAAAAPRRRRHRRRRRAGVAAPPPPAAPAAAASGAVPAAAGGAGGARPSEQVTITTDVVRATLRQPRRHAGAAGTAELRATTHDRSRSRSMLFDQQPRSASTWRRPA